MRPALLLQCFTEVHSRLEQVQHLVTVTAVPTQTQGPVLAKGFIANLCVWLTALALEQISERRKLALVQNIVLYLRG